MATTPRRPLYSGLTLRVVSAVVAVVALVGSAYFAGARGWIALTGLIVLAAQNEFSQIFFSSQRVIERATFILLSVLIFVVSIFRLEFALPLLAASLVVLLAIFIRLGEEGINPQERISAAGLGALGLLYVGVLPGLAIHLLTLENGFRLFLLLLLTVFSGDIFAYFIGIRVRGPKLWISASPNKTWSGAVGGLVGSVGVGSAAGYWLLPEYSLPLILSCAVFGAISAQVGDLFESLLKRAAGVKDSGSLMPGHGGLLDRIDGVLFSAPWFYVLFLWQGK